MKNRTKIVGVKNCRTAFGASGYLIDTHKATHSQISIKQPNGYCVACATQNYFV